MSPTHMIMQLQDIAPNLRPDDARMVARLADHITASEVAALSDDHLTSLRHIHRQHFCEQT